MKAIGILLVLAIATAAVLPAPAHATESAWMLLSGITLLTLASAVRRYIP